MRKIANIEKEYQKVMRKLVAMDEKSDKTPLVEKRDSVLFQLKVAQFREQERRQERVKISAQYLY